MIRLTASMLETYRRFMDTEYTTYDDMIHAIDGTGLTSPEMALGVAVHKALENYNGGELATDVVVYDGYTLDSRSLEKAGRFITPMWLKEVDGQKSMRLLGDEVFIRCKTDALVGTFIVDHKVTGEIDAHKVESYLDSMQWRAYLWVFGGTEFMYNTMVWSEENGVYNLREAERVFCNTYNGLESDLRRCAQGLYAFVRANNRINAITKREALV